MTRTGIVVDNYGRRGEPLPDGSGFDYSQRVLLVDIGGGDLVFVRTPREMRKGKRVRVRPQDGDLMLTNGEWLLVPEVAA